MRPSSLSSLRAEALQQELLTRAVDAGVLSEELQHVGNLEDDSAEAVARNRETIRRLHSDVVECFQYFAAFADACARPLDRHHDYDEGLLHYEGDYKRFDVVSELVSHAMARVRDNIAVTLPRFSYGGDLFRGGQSSEAENLDEIIAASAFEHRKENVLAPIQGMIADMNLIIRYFTAQHGSMFGDDSRNIFHNLQARFLGDRKGK